MVSWSLLARQDDVATAAALDFFISNSKFAYLAEAETKDILDRDAKDASALREGIKFAQLKGVLPKITPPSYTKINVLGKTGEEVAKEILEVNIGEAKCKSGCVVVLVGLSGTGKGTTVSKMREQLAAKNCVAVTWSNGNAFRCLTLLACEKAGSDSDVSTILSPENLSSWIDNNLKFLKNPNSNEWDIELTRLDNSKVYVSDVCNSLLKEPRISRAIPTVAAKTQGEVVKFAADACTQMASGGCVVLVEGREDTVNFIQSEFRFELNIPDTGLIGKRRAAQRIVAEAVKDGQGDCKEKLEECLDKIKE